MSEPTYPLKVVFHEDGEVWEIADAEDAACNLEWFDSDDPEEKASVVDSKGRPVRLKVEELSVVLCEIAHDKNQ